MEYNQSVELLTSGAKISIFDFADYSEYLNAYVQEFGKYGHGPYNLKNWAKRLGYRSPSSLAMVLNKQRLPTFRMIASFSEDFKLNKNERRYFEVLVELERKKEAGELLDDLLKEARRLSGFKEYQQINFDQFTVVSDWYCFVIKRLVSKKGFIPEVDWIFKTLRKKVSKAKIRKAIESLLRIELLKRTPEGGLEDSNPKVHTGNQVSSSAIRSHHRGMMERALDALDEQSVKNRMFQGLTLNLDKKADLPMAFEDIKQFIDQFNNKYSKDRVGDCVYQLNVQLYEHTDSENEA